MSRDPQVRSGLVLSFGPASLGALMGSVAEELRDSKFMEWFTRRRGPRSVDLWLVWSALNVQSNGETRPCLAHGSRIYIPATRPVDLTLIGERVRTW